MKYIYVYIILLYSLCAISCTEERNKKEPSISVINRLSYTDVIYFGEKDTALVSTFDGRILKFYKNGKNSEKLFKIDDEIYAMKHLKKQDMIVITTLKNGIVFIDDKNFQIKKKIPNKNWSLDLYVNEEEDIIIGNNRRGQLISLRFSDKKIEKHDVGVTEGKGFMSRKGEFYLSKNDTIRIFNKKGELKSFDIQVSGIPIDIDPNNYLLLINDNEFICYDLKNKKIKMQEEHPYWIYSKKKGDTSLIGSHYKLTKAKFGNGKIVTGSYDRTIRVWNIENNVLQGEVAHSATVSGLDISDDGSQAVSVDMKGMIKFTNLDKLSKIYYKE